MLAVLEAGGSFGCCGKKPLEGKTSQCCGLRLTEHPKHAEAIGAGQAMLR